MSCKIFCVAFCAVIAFHSFVFADGKENYVFWSASPYSRVWMRSSRTLAVFEDDDKSKPVKLWASRNEYEARQFVITPRCEDNPKKIVLSVSELKDDKGHSINKKNITIEWVRYSLEFWRQRYLTSFVPDPLAPTNIAHYDSEDYNGRVNEKTNTVFWVTFYVPKDTPAGTYRGDVIATIDDKVKLSRKVELEVIDVSLPTMTHFRTALFSGPFSEWIVKDLAKHRISFGGLPDDVDMFVTTGRLMHKLGVQVAFVGPWLDVYDALGVRRYYGHNKKKSREQALDSCKQYYRKFYPILKREGWVGEAYSRMPDEFSRPEIAQRVRNYINNLRQWAPGVRTQTTAIPNRKSAEMLVGYCDIWSPSGDALNRDLDFYIARVKAGDEVWPYVHEFTWYYYPAGFLRYYFWALHKSGFDGVCYWTVGPRGEFTRTKFGFIRDDNVCPGDGTLYYPNIKVGESIGKRGGMAGTKLSEPRYWHSARLSRIRDGIEDMEYLWLMKQAIEKAKTKGNISASMYREIKEAHKFIKDFAYAFDYFTADSDKLDKIRKKIAKIIKESER